jgi:glyoxylase I family protein
MIKRINHVGLSVRDLAASIYFYQAVIGMTLVFESTIEGRDDVSTCVGYPGTRARVAFLDAGGSRLELWCYDEPSGRPFRPGYGPADHGFSHIAVEVDDVDAAYDKVLGAGHTAVAVPIDLGIHKACYVHGPDGEIVELLADLGSSAERLGEIMAGRRAAEAAR